MAKILHHSGHHQSLHPSTPGLNIGCGKLATAQGSQCPKSCTTWRSSHDMARRITRAPILNRGYRGSAGSSEAVQDLFHRLTRRLQLALSKQSSVASEAVLGAQAKEVRHCSARTVTEADMQAFASTRKRERTREREEPTSERRERERELQHRERESARALERRDGAAGTTIRSQPERGIVHGRRARAWCVVQRYACAAVAALPQARACLSTCLLTPCLR